MKPSIYWHLQSSMKSIFHFAPSVDYERYLQTCICLTLRTPAETHEVEAKPFVVWFTNIRSRLCRSKSTCFTAHCSMFYAYAYALCSTLLYALAFHCNTCLCVGSSLYALPATCTSSLYTLPDTCRSSL